MTIRICARLALVIGLGFSVSAHAALQGRDLDGNSATFEAYYDTVLDITWLADANYAQTSGYDTDGMMTWSEAATWAANLSFTDGINVYDNWRLPTIEPINGTSFNYPSPWFNYVYDYMKVGNTDIGYNITSPNSEMSYMHYVNLGNPGAYATSGVSSGCYVSSSDTCLDNVGPFTNLQSSWLYWSGTEYEPIPGNAVTFEFMYGKQGSANKDITGFAWAVSPGDVAAVPEAQAYALMLAGLGLIAWRARRRG